MTHQYNDGGRAAAGYKGNAGDCVARAIAIASGRPYGEVYNALAQGNATQRRTRRTKTNGCRRSARNGIYTTRQWFKQYMAGLGFTWVATMGIGTGCTVHLDGEELPMGRLVVAVSRHYCAVVDRVIHDTYDPRRAAHCMEDVLAGAPLKPGHWRRASTRAGYELDCWIERRCVYGFWVYQGTEAATQARQ